MRSRSTFGAITVLLVLACLALAFGYHSRKKPTNNQLPRGGWVAGFHPYHGAGYATVPVRVFSVKSDIRKGLVGVSLRNRSDKGVKVVTLGWYVSEAQTTGAIVASGETAAIRLSLPSQEKLELATPAIGWEDVLRPAMTNGVLRGDFDIWVVVSQLVYEDGSTWRFPAPTNVSRVSDKLNAHFDAGCANQTCKKDGDVYKCVDGQGELCTNHGSECTSSICQSEGN